MLRVGEIASEYFTYEFWLLKAVYFTLQID